MTIEEKDNKRVRIIIIILIAALISIIAASFAWLATVANNDFANIKGNTKYIKLYFASGSGTSSDPYILNKPEHLCNLAWLQYLGYFNQDNDLDGNPDTVYFKLSASISMSGYVLPPIGTKKYPFVGNFNGNSKTISNLTVTNSSTATKYTNTPSSVTKVSNVNCIGVFGVVGRTGKKDSKCLIQKLRLRKITINVATSTALAGIVAGYLDGNKQALSDIRVYNNSGENSATIYNSSTAKTYTTFGTESGVLSKYSLVGDANSYNATKYTATDTQIAKPSRKSISTGGGSAGVPTTWGGSLGMGNLSTRLDSLYSSNKTTTFSYPTKVTRYIYADGKVTEEGSNYVTVSALKHYHNATDGVDDASGTVAFTDVSGFGGGYFHTLYGQKDFTATRTITTNRELGGDEFFISDGVFYLNRSVDVTNADKVSECTSPAIWKFNTDGSISSTVNGTTYYLKNNGGSLELVSTTGTTTPSGCTGWVKNTTRIYHGSYYLACDNTGRKWILKTYTQNAFSFTDGYGNYLGHSSNLYNSTYYVAKNRTSSSTKDTFYFEQGVQDNTKQRIYTTISSTKYYLVLDSCRSGDFSANNLVIKFVKATKISNPTEFELGYNFVKYSNGSNSYYLNYQSCYGAYPADYTGSDTNYRSDCWSFKSMSNPKQYRLYYMDGSTKYYLKIGTLVSTSDMYKTYITGTKTASDATLWMGDGPEQNSLPTGTIWGSAKINSSNANTYFLRNDSGNLRGARLSAGAYSTAYPWTLSGNKMICKSKQLKGNGTSSWSMNTTGSDIYSEVVYNNPISIDPAQWGVGANYGCVVPHGEGGAWDTTTVTDTGATYTTPETCIPIVTASATSFNPTSTNPGYFLSGAVSHTSTDISTIGGKGDVRANKTYFTYENLEYSNNGSTSYSGSELQILTRSANSDGTVRISDNYNQSSITNNNNAHSAIQGYAVKDYAELGLVRYEESRKQLDTIFKSSSNLYGIHFMDAAISESNIATIDTVQIEGKTYKDYQLPRGSFDFNVSSPGFISFFAGSYYGSNFFSEGSYVNDSFFSLHQIIRKENGDIDHINEIDKVYRVGEEEYVYKYVGSSTYSDGGSEAPSDGTLVFDMDWVKNPSPALLQRSGIFSGGYAGALYYFEIPVNAGEYALGTVSGKTGAYLLYLDIGSSPTTHTSTEETIKESKYEHAYPYGVDFTYTSSGTVRSDNSASFTIAAGVKSSAKFSTTAYDSNKKTTNIKVTKGSLDVKTINVAEGVTVVDSSGNPLEACGLSDETTYKVTTVKEYNNSTGTETIKITTVSDKTDDEGNNATIKTIRKTSSGTTTTETRTFINETVTFGSEVVLRYTYKLPDGAKLTEERDLESYTASGGKYAITMTSKKAFTVTIVKVDSSYNTSTFNKVVMTEGGTISIPAS